MKERVLLVGAGTMGCGIAVVWAKAGHPVTLYDPVEAARASAKDHIGGILEWLVENHALRAAEVAPALARVQVGADLAAAAEATFIVEAASENLDLKRKLFASLDRLAAPDAILATNSSSFTLRDVGAAVNRRERLLATHYWNPAYLIPLVEIARTEQTADWAVAKATALLSEIGKVPVQCWDSAGYIGVRLQFAVVYEAIAMLAEGLATAEDIDKAVRHSFGLRLATMGPLEMADRGGLDIWLHAGDYLHGIYGRDHFRAPQLLRDKVASGELGFKTGRGLHGDSADLAAAGHDRQLVKLLQHLGLLPDVARDATAEGAENGGPEVSRKGPRC